LIVDDEENLLRALRRALLHQPYEIRTATDAEKALGLLQDFQPAVVLSDYRLPGMNGVEFLAQVKARLPSAQRILITGQADQSAIEAAINQSEVFRFIGKPWGERQLLLTLQSAFEQHALITENAHLQDVMRAQNAQLQALNAQLEETVEERTRRWQQAQRDWDTAFDILDFPLSVVDRQHRVQRANRAYARLGLTPTAGTCHQTLFGRGAPCDGCTLANALETHQPARTELRVSGRTYVVSIYPFDDGARAVCAYEDVTDARAQALRERETEKMAAVGQLAGGVAHEINNPLGGLLAFVQLMRRDAGRSPEDDQSLAVIEESAVRCKRIVESLVQFAGRSPEGALGELDLSRCLEDVLLLFQGQLADAPQVRLERSLSPGLPRLLGQPSRLSQVALNLLQNALSALGDAPGTITVSTGETPEGLFFRVEDTGMGIAPAHLSRIFEPTFTTRPPGAGAGLGLSIAYRIVEDHGGRLEVQSAPGAGARFTVHLPLPAVAPRKRNP
jgi:two-component system NtrC family sensor kinase